ncbi:hypothetical protein [Amycolatopsis sp. CA-128772]|uniref:hypothetical protein n=1 Tax=Amycolatopsis sp. CA-128772 TaxID=2073159 RepID=UPI001304D8FE|nr:hypothetical protein [Amycolatopsis sp. CA-128772]
MIAVRKALLVLAGLAFWTGEIMSLFAATLTTLGWGIGLIVGALLALLLITGRAATVAGIVVGAVAVVLGIFQGRGISVWVLSERWVVLPLVFVFILQMRTAFGAIERAEVKWIIGHLHQ